MIALVLLGCSEPPPAPEDTAVAAPDTGHVIDTSVPGAHDMFPVLAAEDVEGAISEVLTQELFTPLDVHAWFDPLLTDLEAGSGTCPERTPSESQADTWTSFYVGDCEGAQYTVSGGWQVSVTRMEEGDRLNLFSLELYSFTGSTSAGGEVSAGGQMIVIWEATPDLADLDISFGGTLHDDAYVDPLPGGVSTALEMIGTFDRNTGLDGTIEGSIAGQSVSLGLDGLVFRPACPAPSGTVSVRDPSSGWWEIELPDDCSGCGELMFAGTAYGTACPGAAIRDAFQERLRSYLDDPP